MRPRGQGVFGGIRRGSPVTTVDLTLRWIRGTGTRRILRELGSSGLSAGYRRGFGVTRVAVGTRCLSHTKRSWKIRVTRKIGWSIDPRIFREARIFRANPTPGRRQRSNTRTPVSRQRAASRGPAVTRRARGTRRQARGTPVAARARSGLPWRATQCRPNRPPPRCHGCSVASMISRRAGQAVSQFERDPGIPPINSLRISGKRVQGLRAGRSALPRWRSPRPRWTW